MNLIVVTLREAMRHVIRERTILVDVADHTSRTMATYQVRILELSLVPRLPPKAWVQRLSELFSLQVLLVVSCS